MERRLNECGYHIFTKREGEEKLVLSSTDPTIVIAEISCSNCEFITQTQARGETAEEARSNAIVKANIERKKFCPLINSHSTYQYIPGEKRVPEYFTTVIHPEQKPQPRGWIALS